MDDAEGGSDVTEAGYLSIAAVRRLTGLSERQIRYYDEKGLVVPERTPGGHRLYTPAHVERLRAVRRLIEEGLSVEEVRQRLDQEAQETSLPKDLRGSQSADDRGLEDVKIYFGRWRRRGHDPR